MRNGRNVFLNFKFDYNIKTEEVIGFVTRGEVRVGQWRFCAKFLLFHDFIYHKILRKSGSRSEQISFNHGSGT